MYNNIVYCDEEGTLTMNDVKYEKIDGYSNINNEVIYIKNNKIVIQNKKQANTDLIEFELIDFTSNDIGSNLKESTITNNSKGYVIKDNVINIYNPFIIYSVNELSGYTESKLSSFKVTLANDDLGNQLLGSLKTVLDEDNNIIEYITPKEHDTLQIPYKIGMLSDITELDNDNLWCNIISDMKFYCKVENSNEIISEQTIDDLEKNIKDKNVGEIKCDITYHMGAIIEKKSHAINGENNGITYVDTVKVVKKECDYYLKDLTRYPIYYYDFEYDNDFIKLNEYSDKSIKIKKSKFSFKIDNIYSSTDDENKNKYRAKHDGLIADEVFRQEYKLGSSSKENIERNVYIERGLSSAFEKHLNLLNVNSLESLEQFGNGSFNIINNNN